MSIQKRKDEFREEFNATTIRLVTELIQITGKDPAIVEMKSFIEWIQHLNPCAYIPTIADIRKHSMVQGFKNSYNRPEERSKISSNEGILRINERQLIPPEEQQSSTSSKSEIKLENIDDTESNGYYPKHIKLEVEENEDPSRISQKSSSKNHRIKQESRKDGKKTSIKKEKKTCL